ncbi:MAG: Hsp70 family protein [Methylococcales bacterium]|nr:Hsp70 family protein [Methylococcales bacterium]
MSESFEHENQAETEANNNEENQQQDHSADPENENDVQDSQSSEAEGVEPKGTKYSVGIDLGTTHCVLSYVDLTKDEDDIIQEVMAIPQLTSPGVVEDKKQLPSFLYLAHDAEIAEGTTTLPWTAKPDYLVGEIARNLGSKTPIRLVASAKSWLCHAGVDCKEPILPSESPEDVDRISPFQATKSYLHHMKDAWENLHPDAPLDQQDVIITVPASFDPAARELTVEAARSIGLSHALLLEEPQSALYSWIDNSLGDWRNHVNVGDIILVIDVGGGTTDLSLIAVTDQDGNLELTRVAVGDHILLGGDNMDLALAYTIKAKMEQESDKRLAAWQIQALTHACRDAKEKIFIDSELDNVPLVVASRGSSLIGGTLRTELTREEVDRVLVEGFLPEVAVSERPVSRPRSGLRTKGLPYAQDAGITRHLAAFLAKQLSATEDLENVDLPENSSFLHPTAVLFNGGVLKAGVLADRLMKVLNSWLVSEQAPEARLLEGADLDLAVAKGAAYYGMVRQGKGVRIKGGTAASYYVGVESAMPAVPGMPPQVEALCIAPFGMEEGTTEELSKDEFGLVIGEPVRFRFFASNTRREDTVGIRLDYWTDEELEELDEIEITLPEEGHNVGEIVPVHLSAAVTEVGTLELHAVSQQDDHRWKIEFDVRE